MGDFDALYTGLDHDERRRGHEFELVCQWFLENASTYSGRLARVWLWKQWPGRWSDGDAGIDLVAEDNTGKLWAIQAKAYGEDKPIPKRELNKFLSESNRGEFAYRLLITTTNAGLHHIAARTVAAQDKPVLIVDRHDLRSAPVDWPANLTKLRPAPPREPAQPRDYQQDAIRDVITGFADHDRGQLIMACGTGKTLTAWFIHEQLKSERTLVLVPSLSLLKQTMREWEAASGGISTFAAMPVCSDASVSNANDLDVAYTAELGVPATTDPVAIADFLRGDGRRVVFGTYHSSPTIAEALRRGDIPPFDLVIADEAHRVAGPAASDFATVLDDDKIPARKRLFMTATPKVYAAAVAKEAKEQDFEQASMEEPAKFGPVLHRLGFGEAINRELLTDYQVVVIGVDDAVYREMAEHGVFVTRDGRKVEDARTLAGQIGLAKAVKKFDLRRIISFHSYIGRSKSFAASMPDVVDWMPEKARPEGRLWAAYASGEMAAGRRARLIQQLTDLEGADRGLLANARCLAEGVDVPALDAVAFIDPRSSEIDIIQAVGRAIRKSDTKKLGTIVIPVFVAAADDPGVALESSAFQPVWNVLRALRSHDDQLAAELDEIRRELGRRPGRPRIPGKIHLDLPLTVSEEFAEAFKVRIVQQGSPRWEQWFGMLLRYVDHVGDARVPHSYISDGWNLGSWVIGQRHDHAKGVLSQKRVERLEALPGWIWNTYGAMWDEAVGHLTRYVSIHGDARVPHGCVFDGFRLGQWVVARRHQYAKGGLSAEQTRQLEELPGWIWNSHDAGWEAAYQLLLRYVREHGGARPPAGWEVDDFNLGSWVVAQRGRYTSGRLERRRVELLECLPGWSWDPFADAWEEGYTHLEQYVTEHGDALVPNTYRAADGFRLGKWVAKSRVAHTAGRLGPERTAQLSAVPGWAWDVRDAKWEVGIRHLLRHIETGGNARPLYTDSVEGYPIGRWVIQQRHDQRKGELSPQRAARLEALPGWSWDPDEESFEAGYARLQAYAAENGTAAVPAEYVDAEGFRLGRWLHSQRQIHLRKKSRPERVELLESLPGFQWTPKSGMWEASFEALMQYVAEHGTADLEPSVEYRGRKLGKWVAGQRSRRNRGQLSEERQRRLEVLPGWWWAREDPFMVGLEHLRRYVAEHGDACVPGDFDQDGYPLGVWVSRQRQRNRRCVISPEEKVLLQSFPGWVWHSLDAAWEEAFARAKRFAESSGGEVIPIAYVEDDGFKLGKWVNTQRVKYRRGTMPKPRQVRLEALPGWGWSARP